MILTQTISILSAVIILLFTAMKTIQFILFVYYTAGVTLCVFCLATQSKINLYFITYNSNKKGESGFALAFKAYSVLKAITGSFLAALREGIMPANIVKITLIAIKIIATSIGTNALKFESPVRA